VTPSIFTCNHKINNVYATNIDSQKTKKKPRIKKTMINNKVSLCTNNVYATHIDSKKKKTHDK